jgi:UDPglucose 6-dehydrogenase
MFRVSVIGMGFVGLSMAVFLADKGLHVIGVERDKKRIDLLKKGEIYFYEPGVEELLLKNIENGSIEFTDNYEYAIDNSDITFICVGTPSDEFGRQDLSMVISASKSIGNALKDKEDYHLVVMRSTVLPGTCRKIVIPAIEEDAGHVGGKFGFVMNPEFLQEGSALKHLSKPNRIVIGEYDESSGNMLSHLYKELYGDDTALIRTTIENAEVIKYANNAFLATKISFINTIAKICELTPYTDIKVVSETIGLDPRIGKLFLRAGIGFGGSCLPKDLRALIYYSIEHGYRPRLLEATNEVNKEQPMWVIEVLRRIYPRLKDRKISVLGVAFKPGTSDIRESQAIHIIKELDKEGCEIYIYDPLATDEFIDQFSELNVHPTPNIEACISNSDAVIIATEWEEFKDVSPEVYIEKMNDPVIIDGRRIYDPKDFISKGVKYFGVGYPIKESFFSV